MEMQTNVYMFCVIVPTLALSETYFPDVTR